MTTCHDPGYLLLSPAHEYLLMRNGWKVWLYVPPDTWPLHTRLSEAHAVSRCPPTPAACQLETP